jgi:hypothetical protein
MTEPKRRWFQIHLSTAVVLTALSGTLLGLNLRTITSYEEIRYRFRGDGGPMKEMLIWYSRGFPFVYSRTSPQVSADELRSVTSPPPGFLYYAGKSHYTWIGFNFVSSGLLLSGVAFLLETQIRRREARKP